MKGKYFIEVWNKKVRFRLDVDRQVSIIRGDSSTGKSYFVELLKQFFSKDNYGVKLKTDFKSIRVYTEFNQDMLKAHLDTLDNTLFVIEEDVTYVKSTEFSHKVKGSNNYFIIINRDDFPSIPYSIWSIYEFESKKNIKDGRVYTETYLSSTYGSDGLGKIYPDIFVCEDSASGFRFFENALNCKVVSSEGNSNMFNKLRDVLSDFGNIALIVDGAAFGCYIGKIGNYLKEVGKDVMLFAPESLECMIIKSGIFINSDLVQKVLKDPYNYCESTKYFSWEQMFTSLLKSELRYQRGIDYSKGTRSVALENLLEGYREDILSELYLLDDSVIK